LAQPTPSIAQAVSLGDLKAIVVSSSIMIGFI
jgi:hypothetical protein